MKRTVVLLIAIGACIPLQAQAPRILHIMSYYAGWPWNVEQLQGFETGLGMRGTDMRVVELDTKRRSSQAEIEAEGSRALAYIRDWHPELIYVNDDDALNYLLSHYDGTSIPIVFSAVNAPIESFRDADRARMTGVLEREHFAATVALLRAIVPGVRRIALIVDESPMWSPVLDRTLRADRDLPDVEIVETRTVRGFDEYKRLMRELEGKVDAVGLLGIFLFKDGKGGNVSYVDVLRWTAENSSLPDFSFWKDRIQYGTLCAVAVSGYEQGLAAGQIAARILGDGTGVGDIEVRPTTKGEPVISLARARKLGIRLSSELLLSSEIHARFAWESQPAP